MEILSSLKKFYFFDFGRPKSKKLDNDNIINKRHKIKRYGNI